MPPPNANGALHLGHAVFVTLQDIMIRFQRMRGRKTLWLPGADHAGFETQVVFDKKLEKEGRNRFQIPRDELFREMLDFTMANKAVMEEQLKKLGASCDWSREKFTLDPDIVATVTDTFARLYDDGLLYRGERIVNWCVKHQTALSDLEVRHEERADPLYHIRYGPLTLATVRPETKFGDTAVAVHPKDKRYRDYVGKEIEIETLLGPAKIKVIADEAVDPAFGTGVIKVTPAHDSTDFEIGKRHNLEVRPVIGKDGRLNEKTGPYAGLKVAEARQRVAADMRTRGLMAKIEPDYKHNVAVCYKCGGVLEPLVMPQWFVAMTKSLWRKQETGSKKQRAKSLRDMAMDAVRSGKVRFIPERTKKTFFHWMANLRDWNISRQISWGIRIPAWYIKPSKPIRIMYFVHGTTKDNEKGIATGHHQGELSQVGERQNVELKRLIAGEKFDIVLSSDLARAIETARTIFPNTKILSDTRLRECDYGELNGKSQSAFKAPEFYIENRHPRGESLKDVEVRIRELLAEISKNYPGSNIAFVSHRAPQLALEVIVNNKIWEEAVRSDWRLKKAWQPGWGYEFKDLVSIHPHEGWDQDPDVLDTWFSSGQWPFATLLAGGEQGGEKVESGKWKVETDKPHSTLHTPHSDFDIFYPTDVMETGYDILFFWVARMIMFGLYRTGKVPFKTVYLHGLVRDKDRQKMSKSKGNVIDPLGVAEQYGTDAVRMALTVGNLPGNDIIISEEKIRGYRNFANKLWNIHRFIMMKSQIPSTKLQTNSKDKIIKFAPDDRKRLKELQALVRKVTTHLEKFEFHHAAETIYHYTWHTFADRIVEEAKPRLESTDANERAQALSLLFEIHSTVLKLLHPFMPFITEELWQDLPLQETGNKKQKAEKGLLMVEPWPTK